MASRRAFITIFAMLAPIPAAAQTADVRPELTACLQVFGAVERLACYDRIARYAAAQSGSQPAGSTPVQQAPPPSSFGGGRTAGQSTPQQFGGENLRYAVPKASSLNRISAGIVSFSAGPSGRFTVQLDNGQVWRQIEGDESVARYSKISTRSVSVTRGMLNSYNLIFNDGNASFKVTRIR